MAAGGNPRDIVEAARLFARLGAGWCSVLSVAVNADAATAAQAADRALQAYAGAVRMHEAAGGVAGATRHLVGAEAESYVGTVYSCVVEAAQLMWTQMLAASEATRTVQLWASMTKYLLTDAVSMLPHLPNERLHLARILTERAQWWMDRATEPHVARRWLQAALECCSAAPSGSTTANSEHGSGPAESEKDVLTRHLLLALANSMVEELETSSSSLSAPSSNEGADATVAGERSLAAASAKIVGYLAAAGGEDTPIGLHAMIKLACFEGSCNMLHGCVPAGKGGLNSALLLFRCREPLSGGEPPQEAPQPLR